MPDHVFKDAFIAAVYEQKICANGAAIGKAKIAPPNVQDTTHTMK